MANPKKSSKFRFYNYDSIHLNNSIINLENMKLNNIPFSLIKNYIKNFIKIKLGQDIFAPYLTTLYLTLRCNYACSFCNDGSSRCKYPEVKMNELNTEEVKKLLSIVKESSPSIYFTGGEPYMRRDLLELCRFSKQIGFDLVAVNTNGSLIHTNLEILDYIDKLVISLSTLNPKKYSEIIQKDLKFFEIVKKNISTVNRLKKKKGFDLIINCVVTKDSIKDAEDVMNFCFENEINFAIVPAIICAYPEKQLLDCDEYKQFIDKVIKSKKLGRPVFNTYKCLEIMRDFKKFKCYPLLTPHIYPDGSLFYPCQMIKSKVDLLKIGNYYEAIKEGQRKFGKIPNCDNRCHLACYIEPSVITTTNPLNLIREYSLKF